jgi:hypothetical protein
MVAERDGVECSDMVWLSGGRPNVGRARRFGYLVGGPMVAEQDGLVTWWEAQWWQSEMVWLSGGRPNRGRARLVGYLAGGPMVAESDGLVIWQEAQ